MTRRKNRITDADVQPETGKAARRTADADRAANHVGLVSPDDAMDTGDTGAEARGMQR